MSDTCDNPNCDCQPVEEGCLDPNCECHVHTEPVTISPELDERLRSLSFDQETDAVVWTDTFLELVKEVGVLDGDTIVGWFANAIMNGFEQGFEAGRLQYEPKVEVGLTDLIELAGTLSVPYLRDNPEYVFPVEEVISIVENFVKEYDA